MKTKNFTSVLYILFLGLLLGSSLNGCRQASDDVWEDSKSCGRHMSRGLRTMGGKHGNSLAIQNRDDFMSEDNTYSAKKSVAISEFVPLSDQPNFDQTSMADYILFVLIELVCQSFIFFNS